MDKRFTSFLIFFSILFLILFAVLSYYSRLATDDYYFIGDIKNHGTFEQIYFQYRYWSGRYSSLSINIIYNLLGIKQRYYNFLPPLSLFLLIAGIYYFIKNLSLNSFITLSKSVILIYSICISAFFFFLSFDIAESWFWYCGYSSYLWSITALIWGIRFIINKKSNWYLTILGALCFIYVGGASELYSSIIILFYTLIVIYVYKQLPVKKQMWQHPFYKKMIIIYSAFLIAFIILLVAPGNYVRDLLFPEHSILKSFFITAKSIVKFLIFYLPAKFIYLFCFVPIFILLGIFVKPQITRSLIPFQTILKKVTLLFISTLLLFFYLTAYVMVETGPARVLLFVSFVFTCYIIFISFYTGLTISFKNKKKLKILSVFSGVAMLTFHLVNQTSIASNYSKANDHRINYIYELKQKIKKDTLITLPPLPPSGMLYSSEITSDTNHFTNRELKMGYDVPFHLIKGNK